MYDLGKVLIGLILFLAFLTIPFWMGLGSSGPEPEVVIKPGTARCVEPAAYMRPNHMQLLNEWRDQVVRESDVIYTSTRGDRFEKSLSKTCLDCHSNKEEFCDRCHDYADVKPYCWSCHLVPGDQI